MSRPQLGALGTVLLLGFSVGVTGPAHAAQVNDSSAPPEIQARTAAARADAVPATPDSAVEDAPANGGASENGGKDEGVPLGSPGQTTGPASAAATSATLGALAPTQLRAEAAIEVTSGLNDGPGTLRAAVEAANASPDVETTITFAKDLPKVTVTEMIVVDAPIVIRGNGQDSTEIHLEPQDAETWTALLYYRDFPVRVESLTASSAPGFTTGFQLVSELSIRGDSSISNSHIVGFGDMGVEALSTAGDSVTISDTTFSDNGTAVHLYSLEATPVTIARTTVSNSGLGIYLDDFRDSPVTVSDSVFVNNALGGLYFDQYTPGESSGALVERTLFDSNGSVSVGSEYAPDTGGFRVSGDLNNARPGISPVRLVDSTFSGNRGEAAGAMSYQPQWGIPAEGDEDTPRILVSGSTFVDNIGGETAEGFNAGAASILVQSIPMRAASGPEQTREFKLRVENSTFDGSAAMAAGRSGALLAEAFGGNRLELDHVTAVSSTINLLGYGPANSLSVARSAIDSAGADPFTLLAEEEAGEPHEITVTDTVFTRASAGIDIETGSSQVLPLGSLQLGQLADNGGPTATMLPAEDSALLDAVAGASPLAVDQRGLSRPIGSAADIGAVEVQEVPQLDSSVSLLGNVTAQNGDTAVFRIERTSGGPAEELPAATVAIRTSDGSAKVGVDYVETEATLSWAAGETGVKTLSVPTERRTGPLGERTFTVTLSTPSEHLTVVTASADGILPAISGASVPPTEPPISGGDEPGSLSGTGGTGPGLLPLFAALTALAGAALLGARKLLRNPGGRATSTR